MEYLYYVLYYNIFFFNVLFITVNACDVANVVPLNLIFAHFKQHDTPPSHFFHKLICFFLKSGFDNSFHIDVDQKHMTQVDPFIFAVNLLRRHT